MLTSSTRAWWPPPQLKDQLARLGPTGAAGWRTAPASQWGMLAGAKTAQARLWAPLSLFRPSPAQIDVLLSTSLRRLVRAGNRAGKSQFAAAELVAKACTHPRGRYRAVGPTFTTTNRVVGRLLYELIPPGLLHKDSQYDPARGWKHRLIRLTNGAEIEIRSYDQLQTAHAGSPLHGIWLDEPPPFNIFVESETRLRDYSGWMLITATPAGMPMKYLKELVEHSPHWKEFVIPFDANSCPWYSDEQIAEIIEMASWSPATFDQRINGAWEGVTDDRFFSHYDPTISLKGRDKLISKVPRWRIGIDHGQGENRQVAYLIGADVEPGTNRARTAHVFREFKSGKAGLNAAQIAAGLKNMVDDVAKVGNIDARVIWGNIKIVGDSNSAGLGKRGLYNAEISSALSDLGVHVRIDSPDKRPGNKEEGESLINELLSRTKDKSRSDGFTLDPSCTLLADCLSHYIQGKKDLADPADAVRYGLWDLLTASRSTVNTIYRG